ASAKTKAGLVFARLTLLMGDSSVGLSNATGVNTLKSAGFEYGLSLAPSSAFARQKYTLPIERLEGRFKDVRPLSPGGMLFCEKTRLVKPASVATSTV